VRRAALLALASCAALWSAVARADDPPAPSGDAKNDAAKTEPKEPVAEVRVIGDKADALQKVPGSGTLVTTKEIEREQPQDVSEVLRRVPGMTATQENGGGLRLDIGIHGLDPGRSRRVLVLEDGVPVAVNPYSEPDLYYAPAVERMRGVEVVKGSGNILFGPQTIGGVINFLTIAPPDHREDTAELDVGFWQGDRCGAPRFGSLPGCFLGDQPMGYGSVLLRHGDAPSEHVRYVIQVLQKESDGVRAESFAMTDVLGKLVFDTSSKGEATLKLGFHDDATRSDDNGLTQQMYLDDPRQPTLAPADHIGQQRYDVSLTHVQRIDDATKLTTLAYAYETRRIWNRQDYDRNTPGASLLPEGQYATLPGGQPQIYGDPGLTGGAMYFRNTDTILDRHYEVAGVEPRLEWRTSTGPIAHTVNAGARLLYEDAHYQQRTGSYPSSQDGSLDYAFQHGTWAFATYVEDRLEVRDWLLVTPGVRIEQAYFASEVTRSAGQDVVQPSNGSADGVIPGIGIVAGTPKANVYAGMHVGWAPPRVTSPISPNLAETVQLSPESSINYELGTRLTYKRLLHFEGTAYLIDFDNQVIAASSGGPYGGVTDLVNGGATRHYGVEGGASFGLGDALKLRPTAIDLGVRYTLARAYFDGGPWNGNWLPYAPAATLVTMLDVDHPASGLGGEIAWSYVSDQFTDPQDTLAPDATGRYGKMPAYGIVDVDGRYKLRGTGLTFKLAIKDAENATFVAARRPDGIRVGGFREIVLGVRCDL